MTGLASALGCVFSWVAVERQDPWSSRDDCTLVRAVQRSGDDDAFAALVHRYKDRVFRLSAGVLGPGCEADAEDVAQETFLQVHRRLCGFRGDCAFSSWLYRMALNRAIDRRRKLRRTRGHLGEEALADVRDVRAGSDPELVAEQEERTAVLWRSIEWLTEPQRTVVYLHYWLERPVTEIAELLDLNRETVKSHLHRARRRLARQLGEERAHG